MTMKVRCRFGWKDLECKVACYEDAHALIEMLKNATLQDDEMEEAIIVMYEREVKDE